MSNKAKIGNKSKLDLNKSSTYKNKDSRHHGPEEALKKKAAEEEAERQRQAANAAEEARLAKEEELRSKKHTVIDLMNDEEKQKDILAWVRSVPLSQGCIERMDRAFSDGSLVAEVIHHFCPSICNKRQYFRWNSRTNKISNWSALNNKVFPKLGFRLNQAQINNLLNPFSCGKFQKDCEQGLFIYKLLHRIRKELGERNPSVFDYRKPNFVPPSCEKKSYVRKLANFLDRPPYSKVEMLIEQGFYDEKKVDTGPDSANKSQKCSCQSPNKDCCFQTIGKFFPYNFPLNGCWATDGNDNDCEEICIQPSISINWDQSTSSCFSW